MVKVYVNCTLIGEKIVALPDYCPSTMTGFELVAGSGCLNEELFPCTSGFNVRYLFFLYSNLISLFNLPSLLSFRDHYKALVFSLVLME